MNFFSDSISSFGGNSTFTEKLFGRRDSIASIVAREISSELLVVAAQKEQFLEQEIEKLKAKIAAQEEQNAIRRELIMAKQAKKFCPLCEKWLLHDAQSLEEFKTEYYTSIVCPSYASTAEDGEKGTCSSYARAAEDDTFIVEEEIVEISEDKYHFYPPNREESVLAETDSPNKSNKNVCPGQNELGSCHAIYFLARGIVAWLAFKRS